MSRSLKEMRDMMDAAKHRSSFEFAKLPSEILENVKQHLPCKDLLSLCMTSPIECDRTMLEKDYMGDESGRRLFTEVAKCFLRSANESLQQMWDRMPDCDGEHGEEPSPCYAKRLGATYLSVDAHNTGGQPYHVMMHQIRFETLQSIYRPLAVLLGKSSNVSFQFAYGINNEYVFKVLYGGNDDATLIDDDLLLELPIFRRVNPFLPSSSDSDDDIWLYPADDAQIEAWDPTQFVIQRMRRSKRVRRSVLTR